MKKLSRDAENVHVYIDAGNKPKLRISPGESFCLETIRADNNFLSRDNPVYRDFKHVMEVPANPVTGPVFVEGAEPGDRIAVSIEDIRLGDSGNEGYYTYVSHDEGTALTCSYIRKFYCPTVALPPKTRGL